MALLEEKIIGAKPQLIAVFLISLIVFSPQIYADSYLYYERFSFVPISKIDMIITINHYDSMDLTSSDDEILVEKTLLSRDYIIGFYDFHMVNVQFLRKKDLPQNTIPGRNITIAKGNLFQNLNFSIVKGVFTNSGVLASERVVKELNITIGSSIELVYVCQLRNVQRTYCIELNVSGVINQSLSIFTTDIVIDPTLFNQIRNKLDIIQDFCSVPLAHIYVADIDENFIDFVNPEVTLNNLLNLKRELYSIPRVSHVWLRLYTQLNEYFITRQMIKMRLLYNTIPLFIVFLVIYIFIIDFMMSKRKKELAIVKARGWDKRFVIIYIWKEIIKSFIIGIALGFLSSFIASRLYVIVASWAVYGIFDFETLFSFPVVISISTIQRGSFIATLLFLLSLLMYTIIQSFQECVKSENIRFLRGIIKKLYYKSASILFHILALVFGASVVYYAYTHDVISMLIMSFFSTTHIYLYSSHTFFFLIISIFEILFVVAPFMLLVSATYFFILFISKLVSKLVSWISRSKSSYRFFLALKNLHKRDSKVFAIVIIFALMISTNTLTLLNTTIYAPYKLSQYKKAYGSDLVLFFKSSYNLTVIQHFIENISTIDGISEHSFVARYTLNLDEIPVRIYGINASSFSKCFFVNGFKTLKETRWYKYILKLDDFEKCAIVSKTLAEKLSVVENSSIQYYDNNKKMFEYFSVKGLVDFDVPYLWDIFDVYEILFRPKRPVMAPDPKEVMKDASLVFRQPYFLFVNQSSFKEISNFDVVVLFTLASDADATLVKNAIIRNIKQTPIQVSEPVSFLESYVIYSAIEDFQSEVNTLSYQMQVFTLNINFLYILIFMILVMWIYSSLLIAKRPREFGILLAIGLKKRDIIITVFYENIILYLISIPVSLIGIIALAPAFSLFYGLPTNSVHVLFSRPELYNSSVYSFLAAIIGIFIFSIYAVLRSTKLDPSELLKIEWSVEEFEHEVRPTK